jgi:general secretion pathway protein F
MQFKVHYFDLSARAAREQLVEAVSRQAVEENLAQSGHVPLSVRPVAGSPAWGGWRSRARKLDVAWWCRELRTLVSAGMTVVEALETLHAQPLGAARAQVHASLVARLRQGRALSDSMRQTGQFPDLLIAGVRASERTSSLVAALDDYLRYDDMLTRLRKQAVSAAIYPSLVLVLGALISLFLLLFVMPRFAGIYNDIPGSMGWTTHALLVASRLLNEQGAWVVVALVALLVASVWGWQAGLVSRAAAVLVDGIEPLRRRIDEFRLAKLYHSLTLMFRGGYSLDDALTQCAGLGLGPRLRQSVEAARTALRRGQRVSAAMADAGLTDEVSARLLAVGERTGDFDRVLQTIADRHGGQFTLFVERATRIIEPVLLLVVALVVGSIVVMMYMPVFDIASSVR